MRYLFIILLLLFSLNLFSQSKMDSWKIDKIPSITIENKVNDNIEIMWFGDRNEVDTILYYIKNVSSEIAIIENKKDILNNWIYRITPKGYTDQIIICDEYISIGKTLFKVDSLVIKKFENIIKYCN